MRGGGEEGVGEDVTYDALDHVALQEAGPVQELAGSWTLGSFFDHVGELDLFPAEPVRDVSRLYRRWAFESAALDLALRQQATTLAQALGRELRPVTFVVSLRLGTPATLDPVSRRLDRYPTLRFKLDPTPEWTDDLIAQLVQTGAVDSVDFKGFYQGTVVDNPPDPELYGQVVEAFPDAWLEDPGLNDETRPVLEPHSDRFTWDAPIHSIADIEALPYPPKMVNVKPSRFGSVKALHRRLRLPRRTRHRRLRRRPVRARSRPRPHPVPRIAVPSGHAQRRGAGRIQPRGPAARAPGQPAGAAPQQDRFSLGVAA